MSTQLKRLPDNPDWKSKYYQALKLASELIHYEQEVLKHANADTITESL